MKISLIHICFGEMCKRCYRQAYSDMSLFTQSISQRLLFPLILQHAYRKQGFRYLVFLHVTRESSHIIQVAVSYYSGHACFGRSDERNDTNIIQTITSDITYMGYIRQTVEYITRERWGNWPEYILLNRRHCQNDNIDTNHVQGKLIVIKHLQLISIFT